MTNLTVLSTAKQILGVPLDIKEALKVLRPNTFVYLSWGVSKIVNLDNKGLLLFVNGKKHRGYVLITLTPMDWYKVTLINIRGNVIRTQDEVCWGDLATVVDELIET